MPVIGSDSETLKEYLGPNAQGRIYLGSNLVQKGTDVNDIIAFYDVANSNSYPGSGSTLYDLSGNNNDLIITGSVTYSAVSQSLIISGSTLADYGQIYSPNQVTASVKNLLGTGSVFTIITFQRGIAAGINSYAPHWSFGEQSLPFGNPAGKLIAPDDFNTFLPFKIGIQTQMLGAISNTENYHVYLSADPGDQWYWYNPPVSTGWVLQAHVKTDVNGVSDNLTILQRGVNNNTSSLLSATLNSSYPKILGVASQTTFNTSLDNQYLYIGKNPYVTTDPGKIFHFGGMVIINRVLDGNEINNYWNLFFNSR
jgi:hypothetical protein